MRNKTVRASRGLRINQSKVGKDLMTLLRERMDNTMDPKMQTRPLLYTERKDGVPIEGNPKTDQWDVAQLAKDTIARTRIARRTAFDQSGLRGNEKMEGSVKEVTVDIKGDKS